MGIIEAITGNSYAAAALLLGIASITVSFGVSFFGIVKIESQAHPNAARNARIIGYLLVVFSIFIYGVGHYFKYKEYAAVEEIQKLKENIAILEKRSGELVQNNKTHNNENLVRLRSVIQNRDEALRELQESLSGLERENKNLRAESDELRNALGVESRRGGDEALLAQVSELEQTLKENMEEMERLRRDKRSLEETIIALEGVVALAKAENGDLKIEVENLARQVELKTLVPEADKKKVGGEKAQEVYNRISGNASDYVALLFYRNPRVSFDVGAAIRQIAYAITGDISFFGDLYSPPPELERKVRSIVRGLHRFNYLRPKMKTESLFGEEVEYIGSYVLSSSGLEGLVDIYNKYDAKVENKEMLERLAAAIGRSSGFGQPSRQDSDAERIDR